MNIQNKISIIKGITFIIIFLLFCTTVNANNPLATGFDVPISEFEIDYAVEIISAVLYEKKNQFEIIKTIHSNASYTSSNGSTSVPDKVWKEIYGVINGKLILIKSIEGIHIPARHTEERYEFPED